MFRSGGRLSRIVGTSSVAVLATLCFVYGLGLGIYHWRSFHLWKGTGSPEPDATAANRGKDEAAAVGLLVEQKAGSSRMEQARCARQFVFANSLHRTDDEHKSYAWDTPVVLRMLENHYRTRQHPPHLSCGPRSLALKAVLDALAIESRVVQVFSDDYDDVKSHTFLEVHDDQAKRWVIHDPDYDITYVDTRTGQPVPLMRLILGDLQSVVPESGRGRGWELNGTSHLKTHYFEAARYRCSQNDSDIIMVNADRFSMQKRFPGNGQITFAEFSAKNYLRPAFLVANTLDDCRVGERLMR
jgi:hypothetical protein